jgi:hypothetical protein
MTSHVVAGRNDHRREIVIRGLGGLPPDYPAIDKVVWDERAPVRRHPPTMDSPWMTGVRPRGLPRQGEPDVRLSAR